MNEEIKKQLKNCLTEYHLNGTYKMLDYSKVETLLIQQHNKDIEKIEDELFLRFNNISYREDTKYIEIIRIKDIVKDVLNTFKGAIMKTDRTARLLDKHDKKLLEIYKTDKTISEAITGFLLQHSTLIDATPEQYRDFKKSLKEMLVGFHKAGESQALQWVLEEVIENNELSIDFEMGDMRYGKWLKAKLTNYVFPEIINRIKAHQRQLLNQRTNTK